MRNPPRGTTPKMFTAASARRPQATLLARRQAAHVSTSQKTPKTKCTETEESKCRSAETLNAIHLAAQDHRTPSHAREAANEQH